MFERKFSLASFVLGHDSSMPKVQVDERWLVECKHCSHMTVMQEAFIFLQDTPKQTFRDYDDTEHVIRGVGRVRFLLDCGEPLEVAGVLYIPGLRVSILSVSSLDDAGFFVVF